MLFQKLGGKPEARLAYCARLSLNRRVLKILAMVLEAVAAISKLCIKQLDKWEVLLPQFAPDDFPPSCIQFAFPPFCIDIPTQRLGAHRAQVRVERALNSIHHVLVAMAHVEGDSQALA